MAVPKQDQIPSQETESPQSAEQLRNRKPIETESPQPAEQLRNQKPIDDISLYMTYQNWCWMNYSFSLYQKSIYQTAQNLQVLNSLIHRSQQVLHPGNVAQQHPQQQQPPQPQPVRTTEKLAPIQKRIVAEIIDFFILALIKIAVVFFFYGDSYIEHFNFIMIIDEETSIDDLQWMMLQAMLFRLVVVAYEGYMLSGTLPLSKGSTLGKQIMGLAVVYSKEIEVADALENTVHIVKQPLGTSRSCLRSLLKNMSISFLFPMLLPVLMFSHSRLIYDLAVNSLVIEKQQRPRNRR